VVTELCACGRRKQSRVAESHNAIGISGNIWIVGYHQHRDPTLAVEPSDDLHDFSGVLRIEISGRLIGQQNRWIIDQPARDSDALSLATRKLIGIVLLPSLKPDLREQQPGTILALPIPLGMEERQFDVLQRRCPRQQIEGLKN